MVVYFIRGILVIVIQDLRLSCVLSVRLLHLYFYMYMDS